MVLFPRDRQHNTTQVLIEDNLSFCLHEVPGGNLPGRLSGRHGCLVRAALLASAHPARWKGSSFLGPCALIGYLPQALPIPKRSLTHSVRTPPERYQVSHRFIPLGEPAPWGAQSTDEPPPWGAQSTDETRFQFP